MKILSHRGHWKDIQEKNQKTAFARSFDLGFGTETDLRDCKGEILISHDMPKGNEISFEEVLKILAGRNLPLALNIKADGLGEAVRDLLAKYGHTNYFTFDMSIPDMFFQVKLGLKVFTGLSDLLSAPVLLNECEGVWLDCFLSDWYDAKIVDDLLDEGKKVCLVSSELHRRGPEKQWNRIKECQNLKNPDLMLCTDMPEDAERYFHVAD